MDAPPIPAKAEPGCDNLAHFFSDSADSGQSASGLHSTAHRASLLGACLEILPALPIGAVRTCLFPMASPTPQP